MSLVETWVCSWQEKSEFRRGYLPRDWERLLGVGGVGEGALI